MNQQVTGDVTPVRADSRTYRTRLLKQRLCEEEEGGGRRVFVRTEETDPTGDSRTTDDYKLVYETL